MAVSPRCVSEFDASVTGAVFEVKGGGWEALGAHIVCSKRCTEAQTHRLQSAAHGCVDGVRLAVIDLHQTTRGRWDASVSQFTDA